MKRIYVAIVNSKEVLKNLTLNDRKRLYTCGIHGVDIRLSGASATPQEASLIEEVKQSGIDLRLHSWTGKTDLKPTSVNGTEGGMQGYKLGAEAKRLGATMMSGNHEKGVWYNPYEGWNQGANAFIREFAFGVRLHGVQAGELGYSDPSWHYVGATIDQTTQEPYTIKHVMAYQSSYTSIKKTIDRAKRVWTSKPLSIWVGCGRVDSNNQVVGNENATKRIIKEHDEQIKEVVFYVGNGAWKQIHLGHNKHKSIIKIVEEMKNER